MKKLACFTTALAIAASLLAGCGGQKAGQDALTAGQDHRIAGVIGNRDIAPLSEASQKHIVNLGYYNCDHMTAAPIALDSGIFDALGLNVNVTGNGRVPEAMSAGHMDMGYVNYRVTLSARQAGTPLFVAAENHSGGAEYLVVSNKIKDPKDLIGKKIAIDSDPMNHLNWVEWTQQLGIPNDVSQYQNFVMSDADKYFAFVAGELDAFFTCDPWASMAEYENTGWIMRRMNTDRPSGHGTCCKVVMSSDFAEKYPDLAERMLLAHALSIQYMYRYPYRSAEIFANNYNVPLEVGLMTLYKKMNEEGRTIRWDLNVDHFQNQLNTLKAFNARNDINSLDPRSFIDLKYFNNSGAGDFQAFIREKVDTVFPIGMSFEEFRSKALEIDGVAMLPAGVK